MAAAPLPDKVQWEVIHTGENVKDFLADQRARAQADGRPVILVTGHFGNYEAARVCLIAQGIAFGVLMIFIGEYDAVYLGALAAAIEMGREMEADVSLYQELLAGAKKGSDPFS